jgi:HPt (histidine-containing phosphotransfer) domain-containing protein
MTAHAMRGDRERCLAAGMDAYIAKPIDTHRLIELVESFRKESASNSFTAPDNELAPLELRGQLDVVDLAASLSRLGGDPNLLREIILLFFEDSPELLARVKSCAEAGQAREAERAAHSIKGLTSNFDAKRAAAAAGQLEDLAHAGQLAAVLAALPKLDQELELLRRELKHYMLQLT